MPRLLLVGAELVDKNKFILIVGNVLLVLFFGRAEGNDVDL